MSANSVLAKMAVQIAANTAQFNSAMKNSQGQMLAFQRTMQRVQSTMIGFGVGFGLFEVVRAIGGAIDVIADFEKTMSEVKAITGATGDQFRALEADAQRLGASTKFTATQVAQLQVAYGRLGFSTQEILDATEATLDLAAATGEDLAKAADVAGATVRGFELDAKETLRVTDVMASSFNKTALGLDNFTESMKYVAPVGNAAGATVEEVTAMLGILADSGIRGSMAGTSLRKIFTDMTRDGRPLQERLAELGQKGITLADSFDEVGRTAQTSLLILTKNTDKLKELTGELQNSAGEAHKMALIMQDNLSGDVVKMTSALDGLILKFKEGSGELREFVQALTKFLVLLSDDDIIKGIKAWFAVATFVPRHALKAINAILDALKSEGDAFQEMADRRRKIWEDKIKKDLDDQIKKQKEVAESARRSAEAYKMLLKAVPFKKPEMTVGKVENPFYHRKIDMDPTAGFLSKDELENPVDGIVKEIEYNEELAQSLNNLNKLREEQLQKMHDTADMAVTMGEAIGESFAQMAKGEMNFAQVLAKITEQIITLYLRQSIAAMIAKAIANGGPLPFANIALAAAGIGAVKALFSQIGESSGGAVSGGSMSAPGRTPSEMRIGGRFRGYDLAIVGQNESYRRGRLG